MLLTPPPRRGGGPSVLLAVNCAVPPRTRFRISPTLAPHAMLRAIGGKGCKRARVGLGPSA